MDRPYTQNDLYNYSFLYCVSRCFFMELVLEDALELPLAWGDFSERDVWVISLHFFILIWNQCLGIYLWCHFMKQTCESYGLMKTFWAYMCLVHTVILMDHISEVDARTGIPMEEEAAMRHINNSSYKETMMAFLQFTRPQPRDETETLIEFIGQSSVSTFYNIILAGHFLVITGDHFMIVF